MRLLDRLLAIVQCVIYMRRDLGDRHNSIDFPDTPSTTGIIPATFTPWWTSFPGPLRFVNCARPPFFTIWKGKGYWLTVTSIYCTWHVVDSDVSRHSSTSCCISTTVSTALGIPARTSVHGIFLAFGLHEEFVFTNTARLQRETNERTWQLARARHPLVACLIGCGPELFKAGRRKSVPRNGRL